MDDDNSSAHIRNTISRAAYEIESQVEEKAPTAQRLRFLFTTLGFEMISIGPEARSLIKLLVRALIDDCRGPIHQDREQISKFTKVPPPECCRGLSRSKHPAHDILSLASYRECTVAIDKVYSLMGVLGVKFAAFHAEGTTKALCRLLDEVVITTNDVSIFNWAGKNRGSPIRGRSLYPSDLTAFSPEDTESDLTARNTDVIARASKEKRYGLQDTASRITSLLRRTIEFVKSKAYKDVPIDLIRSILIFIEQATLKDLRPQLVNLGKLLVYLENTPSYEEKYKPKTRSWAEGESTKSVVSEGKNAQSGGNLATRFGINTPQISQLPQLSQLPQISAPKFKVGGFTSLYGKKGISKEPEPAKESSNAAPTQPPVATVQEQIEPESLVGEINAWISKKRDIKNVPDEFKELFEKLQAPQAPNLDGLPVGQQKLDTTETPASDSTETTSSNSTETPASESTKKTSNDSTEALAGDSTKKPSSDSTEAPASDGMICPNPIILTTSSIEGVFDIQRVIITMQKPKELRCQVHSAVSKSQKISGQCTISTALSTITVNFSCAAGDLDKQLDLCDVVQQALSEGETGKETGDSTQTELPPTSGQESSSYYSKSTSLSSGFMRQATQPTGATENEKSKQDTRDGEAQTKAFGKTEEQRKVSRMLDFVQETNINLIVGEWVLARFTGAGGAKWFLCQLELGSTHSYYGRRIATDEIDFKTVVLESGLVGHWEDYMHNKKAELCKIVNVFIQGREARRYADEVAGPGKSKDRDAESKTEVDDDSESEGSSGKEKVIDFITKRKDFIVKRKEFIVKRGTHIGAEFVQTVSDKWAERLDGMLSDTILQQVPKKLRSAILNLNENKDLLPAMFLSGVKVHMF
jgi:hypothetical protein